MREAIPEHRGESKDNYMWKYDGVVMLNGGFLEEIPFALPTEGWVDFNKQIWGRLGD